MEEEKTANSLRCGGGRLHKLLFSLLLLSLSLSTHGLRLLPVLAPLPERALVLQGALANAPRVGEAALRSALAEDLQRLQEEEEEEDATPTHFGRRRFKRRCPSRSEPDVTEVSRRASTQLIPEAPTSQGSVGVCGDQTPTGRRRRASLHHVRPFTRSESAKQPRHLQAILSLRAAVRREQGQGLWPLRRAARANEASAIDQGTALRDRNGLPGPQRPPRQGHSPSRSKRTSMLDGYPVHLSPHAVHHSIPTRITTGIQHQAPRFGTVQSAIKKFVEQRNEADTNNDLEDDLRFSTKYPNDVKMTFHPVLFKPLQQCKENCEKSKDVMCCNPEKEIILSDGTGITEFEEISENKFKISPKIQEAIKEEKEGNNVERQQKTSFRSSENNPMMNKGKGLFSQEEFKPLNVNRLSENSDPVVQMGFTKRVLENHNEIPGSIIMNQFNPSESKNEISVQSSETLDTRNEPNLDEQFHKLFGFGYIDSYNTRKPVSASDKKGEKDKYNQVKSMNSDSKMKSSTERLNSIDNSKYAISKISLLNNNTGTTYFEQVNDKNFANFVNKTSVNGFPKWTDTIQGYGASILNKVNEELLNKNMGKTNSTRVHSEFNDKSEGQDLVGVHEITLSPQGVGRPQKGSKASTVVPEDTSEKVERCSSPSGMPTASGRNRVISCRVTVTLESPQETDDAKALMRSTTVKPSIDAKAMAKAELRADTPNTYGSQKVASKQKPPAKAACRQLPVRLQPRRPLPPEDEDMEGETPPAAPGAGKGLGQGTTTLVKCSLCQ